MRRQLIAVSCLALLAACGPKTTEKTPDANPSATILTPANEAAAPDFVAKAVLSDMFELEAAKIAEARAVNPGVKAFAKMMTEAHTKSSAALKAAIAASGQTLSPPTALTEDQRNKLDTLAKADKGDFDESYMDGQISAHQEALDLLTRYANDGDAGPLKTFAVETKDIVQAHLSSAQSLETRLK